MQRGGGGYGGERLDTMEGEDDYGEEEEEKGLGNALEVADDDLKDMKDDEDEELLEQKPVPKSIENLFAIKDHTSDKGLGGLDGTASEVYMSELLAGYDMEDFDETEEQNEEDLIELGDSFADCNIVEQIKTQLMEFAKTAKGADYLQYCLSQLKKEDQELAKKYLQLE